jgi:hypothetical protein
VVVVSVDVLPTGIGSAHGFKPASTLSRMNGRFRAATEAPPTARMGSQTDVEVTGRALAACPVRNAPDLGLDDLAAGCPTWKT